MKRVAPNIHAAPTSANCDGSGRCAGNHPQIVGDQAQPDPAVHPGVAVGVLAMHGRTSKLRNVAQKRTSRLRYPLLHNYTQYSDQSH